MVTYTCKGRNDEEAGRLFNETLKGLPNYAGTAKVQIEGFCDTCVYNQTTNRFEKQSNHGGYRYDSIVSSRELSQSDEDDLYQAVMNGGVCVMIRYRSAYPMTDECILKISPALKAVKPTTRRVKPTTKRIRNDNKEKEQ